MNNIHQSSSQLTDPMEKPVLIGNLSLAHLIFFTIGAFMVFMTIYIRSWVATIGILLFSAVVIMLTARFNYYRHKRLTEIWAEVARVTGLELKQGRVYLVGRSIAPSLSGIYHNHRVSISKVIEHIGDYEGTIPAVFTRVLLELSNSDARLLDVHSKLFSLFKLKGIASANQYFDMHFQYKGHPANFIQEAAQWMAQHPALWERPDGVIMLTDSLLSFTNWTSPSIHLENSKLTYLQSGVVSNIPEQVNILNLLSDLAELVEESGDE